MRKSNRGNCKLDRGAQNSIVTLFAYLVSSVALTRRHAKFASDYAPYHADHLHGAADIYPDTRPDTRDIVADSRPVACRAVF